MRRFQVYCPCWTPELIAVWEDAGFLCQAELPAEGEETPDVIFRPPGQPAIPWRLADTHRPKLFLLAGGARTSLPAELADRYDLQYIQGETLCFSVATRLEGCLESPEWEIYRKEGLLSDTDQIKAVAVASYYYLLYDIMRETFEWCGHTFSVLGPA